MKLRWHIEQYPSLPSTNSRLKELADQGADEGLVLIAQSQTAGRGRSDHVWLSPLGNLYLSLLLRPSHPLASMPWFSLLPVWALLQALRTFDVRDLQVKWPNDLLCRERKLAGFLIESVSTGEVCDSLIVGAGVNVGIAPQVAAGQGFPSTCLAEHLQTAPNPDFVAERFLDAFGDWYERLRLSPEQCGQDLLAALSPTLFRLGQNIAVADSGRRMEGLLSGLTPDGHLLLATRQGTLTCANGSILP